MKHSVICFLILSAVIAAVLGWRSLPRERVTEEKTTPDLAVQTGFHLPDKVEVGVTGTSFHWLFRYPGPDGLLNTEDDLLSERQLKLPQNTEITFKITSNDYVYILGIPLNENLGQTVQSRSQEKIKEIAVPGMTHELTHKFQANGTYDLWVDPLCGFQALHDPLMGQITVDENCDFSALFPSAKIQVENVSVDARLETRAN